MRKAKPATETHESIKQQTIAFLKKGNSVQQIPRGVSGPPLAKGARRHIRIFSK